MPVRWLASAVKADLEMRGVFCNESMQCQVTIADEDILRICLPTAALDSRLCEPYGERWQQIGAPLRNAFADARCASFNLTKLSIWHRHMASRRPRSVRAFVSSTSAKKYLQRKPLRSHDGVIDDMLQASRRFLRAASYDTNISWPLLRPDQPRYASCAVVGAGADLRCGNGGRPRGAEIDAHEAVFRANAFQLHVGHQLKRRGGRSQAVCSSSRSSSSSADSGKTTLECNEPLPLRLIDSRLLHHPPFVPAHTRAHRSRVNDVLPEHSLDPSLAGAKTTHRVNCLFDSHPLPSAKREVCIIPRSWWQKHWGGEAFNNSPHPCCKKGNHSGDRISSVYHLDWLEALHQAQHIVGPLFFVGIPSGVVALDDQLDGSGANALHAAMALCDRVDLYGTGLYGRAPDGDKLYIHASDRDGVGQCAPLPEWCDHAVDGHLRGHSSVMSEPCGYPFRTSAGFNGRQLYKKWLQNRVHAELLTHIMAAMGMVRWM